ncbi:MAG: bifunctional methylenetetrahydrofolate dehydrogenase/methenyltetrahydrofolate cyclohydrolase FolD [Bacteroidetes bacterium]|nr:MAG: bifunctional methylenetetrahydrofolate dehydrogenase/methenyltetrahydrofolate cyclohydrolase FolD [Bacteroidota bacterium]
MVLIDGKKTSAEIKEEIKKVVAEMIDNDIATPHLAAVLVGEDPASQTYVAAKEKACQAVGITSTLYRYSEKTTEKELLEVVNFLNNDPDLDGFIVQLPLPKHIDEQKIIEAINPEKDVDGFHPMNVGRMALGLDCFLPATPNGVMEMLKRYNIETSGKNCVVLGRSHIVGSPMSILMSQKTNPGNATVTLCHSRTENLKAIVAQADIVIAAIGQPHFVTADMVKEGATVIDVGIHRVKSGKTKSGFRLIGDVDFDEVSKKAGFITPVPGGVGPMTIAALLMNTLKSAKQKR